MNKRIEHNDCIIDITVETRTHDGEIWYDVTTRCVAIHYDTTIHVGSRILVEAIEKQIQHAKNTIDTVRRLVLADEVKLKEMGFIK